MIARSSDGNIQNCVLFNIYGKQVIIGMMSGRRNAKRFCLAIRLLCFTPASDIAHAHKHLSSRARRKLALAWPDGELVWRASPFAKERKGLVSCLYAICTAATRSAAQSDRSRSLVPRPFFEPGDEANRSRHHQ